MSFPTAGVAAAVLSATRTLSSINGTTPSKSVSTSRSRGSRCEANVSEDWAVPEPSSRMVRGVKDGSDEEGEEKMEHGGVKARLGR